MKKVYIVFLASNFKSGKFIRFVTRGRYNHVALSLTPEIAKMYSFARSNYYQPMLGGFEIELPDRYITGVLDVETKICSCEVSDERYEKICKRLSYMTANRGKTHYNALSLLTYPFSRTVKIEHTYTCIDFLTELLGIGQGYTIGRLEQQFSENTVYVGALSKQLMLPIGPPSAEFYSKRSCVVTWAKTIALIAILCGIFVRNVSISTFAQARRRILAMIYS